jgi:hypothetical protein
MFEEEHPPRGPAVHLPKIQCKYHQSDIVGRGMVQSTGHQYATAHVNRKTMLEIIFYWSVWIIISP